MIARIARRLEALDRRSLDTLAERAMCVFFAALVLWAGYELHRTIADRGLHFLLSGGAQ